MEHKKDIGHLIREKLDLVDQKPSNELWQKIEKDLNKNEKRKRPLWLITLLLLLAISGTFLFNNYKNKSVATKTASKENVLKTTHTKSNLITNKKITANSTSTIIVKKHLEKIKKQNQSNTKKADFFVDVQSDSLKKTTTASYVLVSKKRKLIQSTPKEDVYETTTIYKYTVKKTITKNKVLTKLNRTKNRIQQNTSFKLKKNRFSQKMKSKTQKFFSKNKKQKINGTKNVDSIKNNFAFDDRNIEKNTEEKAPEIKKIIKNEDKKTQKPKKLLDSVATQKKEDQKKWHVYFSPYFAPTILNNFSTGDAVTTKNAVENFSNKTTFNYGFYLRWMVNEKFGARIGFAKSNVSFQSTVSRTDNRLIDLTNIDLNATQNQPQNNFPNEQKVVLQQDIQYFEVPIEGYYVFKDNKFGLAAAAGISYRFYRNNKISLLSATIPAIEIGSANNINDMGLTANVHVYFTYKISKTLNLELAPAVKYQFLGFENTKDFSPYLLILQAGFSYKL